MKDPHEVVRAIERRLDSTWARTLAGSPTTADTLKSAGAQEPTPPAWPHPFPIGQRSSADLATGFTDAARLASTWRDWATQHQVELVWRARRVMGTSQQLPTHLLVPDIDTAARLAAGPWPSRVTRARARAAALTGRYPHLPAPTRMLAAVDAMSDTDFDLLCRAADWFALHDAHGLTPRQVPIEGLHAKWLNTGQHLIRELAGRADLGLLPPHPARIHFTYLDPAHREAGGRVHDSATVGDRTALAYLPRVVVISENKDTAIHFPPLPSGISIEGVGRGGSTIASFDWVINADAVFYWGDMDADGLEILDGFRTAGVPATSILMNPAAYAAWERFGTNIGANGRPLAGRVPAPVTALCDGELALYHQLIAADWGRVRRIEQERIPLQVAHSAILRGLDSIERPAEVHVSRDDERGARRAGWRRDGSAAWPCART